jgi:hypothetical protein
LEEKIEEDNATRNMDCGKISKRKKTPTCALEHLAGKKEK